MMWWLRPESMTGVADPIIQYRGTRVKRDLPVTLCRNLFSANFYGRIEKGCSWIEQILVVKSWLVEDLVIHRTERKLVKLPLSTEQSEVLRFEEFQEHVLGHRLQMVCTYMRIIILAQSMRAKLLP